MSSVGIPMDHVTEDTKLLMDKNVSFKHEALPQSWVMAG